MLYLCIFYAEKMRLENSNIMVYHLFSNICASYVYDGQERKKTILHSGSSIFDQIVISFDLDEGKGY